MKKEFINEFAICNEQDKEVRKQYAKYDEEFSELIQTTHRPGYYRLHLNDCYGLIPAGRVVQLVREHGIYFDYVKGPNFSKNTTAIKTAQFIDSLDSDIGDTAIQRINGDTVPPIKSRQYVSIAEDTVALVYTKSGEWVDLGDWIKSFDSAYCYFYTYERNGIEMNLFEKVNHDNALDYAQTLAKMMSNKSLTVIARKITQEDVKRCAENELLRRHVISNLMGRGCCRTSLSTIIKHNQEMKEYERKVRENNDKVMDDSQGDNSDIK